MPDPIKLAQDYHDDLIAAGLQQRVEQQLTEDNAELPTFWQGIGNAGQHVIQRMGNEPIEIGDSLTSGGLAPNQRVDAAFSEGFVAIDHTPFITSEQTATLQISRKPSIQILFSKTEPLNPTGSYTTDGDTTTVPGGSRLTLYLKINNRSIVEIGQLTSISQTRIYTGENELNATITESDLFLQNFILVDQNTAIIQVVEEWSASAITVIHHILHTFVVKLNSGATSYYESEEMVLTASSPSEVLLIYPTALSSYQNYLFPGFRESGSMPFADLMPIPVLGETEDTPGITNDQVRFFYKFRQLWVQVLSTAGALLNATADPGWNYFFTNQKYQVASKSTINSNRVDTTYPGFQAIKISAPELQTMAGLALDSIIYRDRFQDSEMLGVVVDTVIPNSPFNTDYFERYKLYYGNDEEYKSWLQFEAVRGIPEVY